MTMYRNIGPFRTTAIGIGEMGLTIEGYPSHDMGLETIHAALDAGARMIDTAWSYYAPGEEEQTGERLTREALETWNGPRDEVLVATKVGLRRDFDGRGKPIWPRDGKPEHLIAYGKQSALALGVDAIDLLYMHRHDPEVPYNESIEAIRQLLDEGVARYAGVSNVTVEQLNTARSILGDRLIAVQNQFSPVHLDTRDVLDYCATLGLAFVCWSPLGGFRHPYDRHLLDPFRAVAADHGVSWQQVTLAWELAQGEHMFVIPGCHRPATILDSLQAGDLRLTGEELGRLAA
ncbi:aldo/keto reductase [Bifidobacterium sp. UBA744]|uniref:aldo/keto reductase n=1 Tax=Bifidobacterium sp. UBA744 TaxID=1946112 RepID=UPI0025BE493F|nr:aldo/keto reductase [Bifidobacterium sp. UBA744]